MKIKFNGEILAGINIKTCESLSSTKQSKKTGGNHPNPEVIRAKMCYCVIKPQYKCYNRIKRKKNS